MAAFIGKDDTGADPEVIAHIAQRTRDYLEHFLSSSASSNVRKHATGPVDMGSLDLTHEGVAGCVAYLEIGGRTPSPALLDSIQPSAEWGKL